MRNKHPVRIATRLTTVVLLGGLLAALTPAFAAAMSQYANERFGYTVQYPDTLFTASQGSANGDGITLSTPDGRARMIVFGGNNALGHDAETMADDLAGLEDISQVTYRRVTDQWIVLSGFLQSPADGPRRIFYERVEFNDDRSAISGFRVEYPATMRESIDHLIGPIGRSLTPPESR